ncbi:MAG TPA: alpha/beta fold hydrolase [Thermoanaerobaculia bacterium]|nr:alpha/beta fold hydrolase [Thermoanaerobaculia bacterium]
MAAARKSASVLPFGKRTMQRLRLDFLRRGFRVASRVAPRGAAWGAEFLFRTPPRWERTAWERRTLSEASFAFLPTKTGRIATWRWGESGPVVFLVHGWGGHAGRLARFGPALRQAGFSVVSFDAPAHGLSDGLHCSLPEFVLSLRTLAERFGSPSGVVAHSLGAVAATVALREGLELPRAVFLAPPADCERHSERFAHQLLSLPDDVCDAMKRRLARRYSFEWPDLSISCLAPRMTARLLVFHDRGDTKVPFKDAEAIVRAWPGAELIPTLGFGHHRILRHPDVVRRTALFLQGRPSFLPIDRLSAAGS